MRPRGDAPTSAPDVSPASIEGLVAEGAAALQLPNELSPLRGAHHTRTAAPEALALLVGVTHDMRSPLSAILLLVERLRSGQSGPLTAAQERQLGLVYSAAFGLASLTNDAFDLAHGTAAWPSVAPAPFSLAGLLRSVGDLVQPIAEEKGLALRCEGPDIDHRYGQAPILHRVLLNLVTNALKYTQHGAVTLTAFATDDARVCFRVDDSGEGLPGAVIASLSGPVWHGPFPDGAYSASGLGLGMCRRLLSVLDSDLQFECLHPAGTRMQFTIALPAS